MVKQEFQTNQVFRYPEEYDQYNQTEEVKMKQIKKDGPPGLNKKDYDAGSMKLESFKVRDKLDHD